MPHALGRGAGVRVDPGDRPVERDGNDLVHRLDEVQLHFIANGLRNVRQRPVGVERRGIDAEIDRNARLIGDLFALLGDLPAAEHCYREAMEALSIMGKERSDILAWADYDPISLDLDVERWAKGSQAATE